MFSVREIEIYPQNSRFSQLVLSRIIVSSYWTRNKQQAHILCAKGSIIANNAVISMATVIVPAICCGEILRNLV